MSCHTRVCRCLMLSLVFSALSAAAPGVESLTVREMVAQQDKWRTWINEKTILSISGRYEGRVAKQFRMAKLPALITPARTTVLPNEIDDGQRLTVSGVLRQSGSRYYLDVNRIAVGNTDLARLTALAERLGRDMPEKLYELADEYHPIAEFYEDASLAAQVQQLRRDAFQQQRIQRKNDPVALRELAARCQQLGFGDSLAAAIRFESLVVRARSKSADRAALTKDIIAELKGWDIGNPFPDKAQEQRFLKNMVTEYEAAQELDRERMHRRFYRTVRLPQMLSSLKPDGSNANELAAALTVELPEESTEVARLNSLYVAYRLKSVPRLTRKQLEDTEQLMRDSNRSDEFPAVLATWLRSQEDRLNNGKLDGLLLMADEYLFAWERWKQKQHAEAGTDLLKQAWTIAEKAAPKEADAIAQRLERLGWTRLNDRWLTTGEVKELPRDNVELAMREGRVVKGMTRAQILGTLGKPSRKVRVISASSVQEIWIFGEAGSTAITVHLQRKRFESPEQSVAILVSKAAR